MVRRLKNRLSPPEVKAAKATGKAYRLNDGDGLYLQISPGGSKSWIYMFRWRGKLKEMGLGSVDDVKLARAREKATEARLLVRDGTNPIEARRASKAIATMPTLKEFALACIDHWAPGWKTARQRTNWRYTFIEQAKLIADRPIDAISRDDILSVLRPIWASNPETAAKTRGRIEKVLDAAIVDEKRTDNPARWKGNLALLLPKPKKLARGHQGAIPYKDLPAFMPSLRALESVSALALEFTILTVSRTSEVTNARWSEVDIGAKVWTVPADRMKAGRIHRVPLPDRAVEILIAVKRLADGADGYLFPGGSRDGCLSNMALAMCLRGLIGDAATVHGFRSSFRDWAGDETDYAREVAEAALSHLIGDKAEQAYRRGDALEKRRSLMAAWAAYLS